MKKYTQYILNFLLIVCVFLFSACVQEDQSTNSEVESVTVEQIQVTVAPTQIPATVEPPEPTPTPITQNFVTTEYPLAQYGITFKYPEQWSLSDEGDSLTLFDPDSTDTMIFIETSQVAHANLVDPVAVLEEHYQSLVPAALKEETEMLEPPILLEINDQKVGMLKVQGVPPKNISKIPLFKGYLAIIINGDQTALVRGITTPDKVDQFEPIFEAVLKSIELSAPAGIPIISPGTVYQQKEVDFAKPILYRLTTTDSTLLTIIAKSEEGALTPLRLSIYNYDENLPLQELTLDPEDLLAENRGNNESDWTPLVFEPEQGKDYLINVGGMFSGQEEFSVYVMNDVPDSQLSEMGNLVAGEPSELKFSANAGEKYLVTVKPISDIDIRFEIQDSEGKRLDVVDFGTEGERETYVFVPETDGDYILRILSMSFNGETEYIASIGEIGSVFSE